ncbi:hypothetical protein PLICRDRAFT_27414 [Plicaturopsis crispa FD-325 SS-3]|nr:hypothetical protein PLICRDRAFT_27414 [Plicaturopsis crispa FD-325 SS-3]
MSSMFHTKAGRPKPDENPDLWYAICDPSLNASDKWWMKEFDLLYKGKWERITDKKSSSYMWSMTEGQLVILHSFREKIAIYRKEITFLWLSQYAKNNAVDELWASFGRAKREEFVMKALLGFTDTPGRDGAMGEDLWQYCPDVNLEDMCSGNGEGFITLVQHFLCKDPQVVPPLDFPILEEPRVWKRFDIKDAASEARRPEGRRPKLNVPLGAHCNMFLVTYELRKMLRTGDSEMRAKIQQSRSMIAARLVSKLVGRCHLRRHYRHNESVRWLQEIRQARIILFEVCTRVHLFYSSVATDHTARECQVHDYKHGNPPHKQICSKPLRDAPLNFDFGSNAAEPERFPLYTKTPTPALRLQVHFLENDPTNADYHLTANQNGSSLMKRFPSADDFDQKFKRMFLRARKKAMEERDLASIAVMDWMLYGSVEGDGYKFGDFTPQLEKEYEVDMEECKKVAAETSLDYQLLQMMFTIEGYRP